MDLSLDPIFGTLISEILGQPVLPGLTVSGSDTNAGFSKPLKTGSGINGFGTRY